ncbi:MAG: aminotransferase class I/II-fold pyridoxal phosphate-dependent enzyme, partial [Oscillospiraceae bacterium]|nr:aminotransferase class I/II-fold pyridoxal phosphate-dependent enzyme [Oscillospiraceae bacterium]
VATAALRHIIAHPELVERLNYLASYMRSGLIKRGIKIIESTTPIVPIFTYDPINTLEKAHELYENGVYVNTVLPPAAPANGCMLRVSIMATHTVEQLDEAMDIIQKVIK